MGRYDLLLQQDKKQNLVTRPAGQLRPATPTRPAPVPTPPPAALPTDQQKPAPLPQPQRTSGQSAKRAFVRRSFDFYEDQVSYLTRVSLEERLAGGEGSMNAMVREAIDDYIKKRKSGK